MPALRELQTRFIDYLTDGSAGMESLIEAKDQAEQQTRLYIYKNAYRIRLRQALETHKQALQSGRVPEDEKARFTYLIGELHRQMGQTPESRRGKRGRETGGSIT